MVQYKCNGFAMPDIVWLSEGDSIELILDLLCRTLSGLARVIRLS